MKLKKLNSEKQVFVKIKPYLIDWRGKSPSKFQFAVKEFIAPYWSGCICCEEFVIPGSRLRIDLINFNKKIVIEASGTQHDKFNKFFHRNSKMQYRASIARDMDKQKWCEDNGFKFVEIYEKDLPLTKKFFKDKFDIDLV
jgi:hypothetical protein